MNENDLTNYDPLGTGNKQLKVKIEGEHDHTDVLMDKLARNKVFTSKSPHFNRERAPDPEHYGQHFNKEALFRMG